MCSQLLLNMEKTMVKKKWQQITFQYQYFFFLRSSPNELRSTSNSNRRLVSSFSSFWWCLFCMKWLRLVQIFYFPVSLLSMICIFLAGFKRHSWFWCVRLIVRTLLVQTTRPIYVDRIFGKYFQVNSVYIMILL